MTQILKLGKRPFYNPEGRIFAIADVHGEAFKLKNLLAKIKQILKPEDHVVFVGDIVDAGPNTPHTLKIIQAFKNEHENTFFILGNHEEMFLLALRGHPQMWLANKGETTLLQFKKYGVDEPQDINDWLEEEKITFFDEFIPYYETEHVLITHAPIPDKLNKAYAIEEGVIENLGEKIRWRFPDPDHENKPVIGCENKLFVCGHTHKNGTKTLTEPRLFLENRRIFLDAGAGYGFDNPIACVIVFPLDQIKVILSN